MTLDTLIMLAGTFVVLLPFLGFPANWDTALFFLVGIAIIGLGIAVRRRGGLRRGSEKHEMFVESPLAKSEHDTY